MHVLVVAEVSRLRRRRLVSAIRGRTGPGELDREQQREEENDQALHRRRVSQNRESSTALRSGPHTRPTP